MNMIKAFTLAAVLAAGAAYAEEERTDPNAIAREELMEKNGAAVGILGGMASGKEAFDAAKAAEAKATLIADAGMIAEVFKEQGAADPASEAKPEIWTNWEDFLAKANALTEAANAIDVASAESIGAGMGAIGGACKDCHTSYRIMK